MGAELSFVEVETAAVTAVVGLQLTSAVVAAGEAPAWPAVPGQE